MTKSNFLFSLNSVVFFLISNVKEDGVYTKTYIYEFNNLSISWAILVSLTKLNQDFEFQISDRRYWQESE